MKEVTLMRNHSAPQSVTKHSETQVILGGDMKSTQMKNHLAVQSVTQVKVRIK